MAFVALILEAATIAGMAVYVASDPTAVGPIFALVVAFGVCRAFAAPATRSLPADTVSESPIGLDRSASRTRSATITAPGSAVSTNTATATRSPSRNTASLSRRVRQATAPSAEL